MNESIILGLIHNTALLLAFSLIYDYSWVKDEETKRTGSKLLAGTIIGSIGIILMMTPWTLVPGIVFDTRSVLLAISGLFFGPVPTLVAVIITGTYRMILGGSGVWMGLVVIVTSGTIGTLWKMLRPDWKERHYVRELLAIGILVHAVMLGCTVLLPKENILHTVKSIIIPVFIVYTPGTVLLGILMVKQYTNWQNSKAKENLLESERRFTEMMMNVNLVSIVLDRNGNVTYCNDYLLNLLGYKEADIIGLSWFEKFTAPESRQEAVELFTGTVKGNMAFPHYESILVAKDGTRFLISWNNTLLRNTDGEIIGTASIGENITARRAAEEQKMQFANILEASLNEIYVFDAETLIFKYVNYGAQNNLGYPPDRIREMTPLDIQPDYKPTAFRRLLSPLKNHTKSIVVYETRNKRMDGSYYPVEIHVQLFEYTHESIYLAIIQDITLRKQSEKKLIEAIKKAEENDRLKSIFLSNMSHEIRTPMNAIIGFSELLNKPGIDDSKRAYFLEIIRNSSNRLLQIINDILDTSKIEAGQFSLHLTECDLEEIIRKCVAAFRKSDLLLGKPGIELKVNLPPESSSLKVISDKNRLQQVLDNLISNAIKYTRKGTVEVGFALRTTNTGQEVEVYIKDTGIGIPEEMKELIFERFRQLEEKGFHEGAGLGLSISKGIVELWGGKIWFTSRVKLGTTFYFTIPMLKEQHAQNRNEAAEDEMIDLKNKTVLIAEDDYSSFLYLKEILEGVDVKILYAENGKELMNILESKLPDLIILDIHMPVKSGLACLKEIQNKGLNVKTIVHTAYAMADERARCFEAGCHGYLAKPIERSELYRVINRVMKNTIA